jgi:putative MATE family efflux protein
LPVMNIIHAFGALIGVGAGARMSIVLGKKDVNWAENILGNSFIFTILLSGLVMIFSYIFLDDILMEFGATANTVAYAHEYMVIVLPGMFLTTMAFNLTSLIRASGYPTKSMLILGSGALLNIALDALFIFVFKWGIAGAAWATTISMAFATFLAGLHFLQRDSFIRFRRHGFRPKGYIFKNIFMIGMSPFLMNVAAAGVVAILNKQLIRYGGDMAVGAYGIANSYILIMIMVILGVCMGMQPIAGYNYGAGHPDRLKRVYVLTMKVCVILGFVTAVVGCAMPRIISMAFTNDTLLLDISQMALPYITVMTPLIAFTIVNSNFFQSIDKPWIAIVTSLSRQVIFLIPMMYLMPIIYQNLGFDSLPGVFCSCTVSDVFGAVLALVLLLTQRKVFRYTI